MSRWLWPFILAFVLWASPSSSASPFTNAYDAQIRAASARYLPGIPWKLGKAQLYQESRLKLNARSPVGAEGIAQFMPATWAEVTRQMGLGVVDRRLAEPSILAWAYYMGVTLRQRWKALADLERHRFALAGYNAGNGSIGRASRACGDPNTWAVVSTCLPNITGRHSAETIGYVRMIFDKWWPAMEVAS